MATDLKTLIKSFSVERGVEDLISAGSFAVSNATGSYQGDWLGDVEIDRLIKISTGYVTGGDALALFLTGLVSGVSDTMNSGDFSEEVSVTLMSLFKSFRKMKITTSNQSLRRRLPRCWFRPARGGSRASDSVIGYRGLICAPFLLGEGRTQK